MTLRLPCWNWIAGRVLGCAVAVGTTGVGAAVPAENSPGQWILVAPPEFRATAEPLIRHRRTEGFAVVTLQTTDFGGPGSPPAGDGTQLVARLRELAHRHPGPTYVLLASHFASANSTHSNIPCVPALRGVHLRMKDLPTDFGYSVPGSDNLPSIRVGRFPARNIQELETMIQKTMAFEKAVPAAEWQNRLLLLVDNPGGGPLAEMFAQNNLGSHLSTLHPSWEVRQLFNIVASPYFLARPQARATALQYLGEGCLFSVFLGHSNAEGMGLDGRFLTRADFISMKIARGAGPFFTVGCFACQSNQKGDGYGLAALRNPDGPVAVIGASGESYSAPGQLAAEGLLHCFQQPPFPARLGEYWLAIQAGLAHGDMDPTIFSLLDAADGTGGKVPLASQRLEHLEMWMLLGDPALRLPLVPVDVRLAAPPTAIAGQTIEIEGTLPARLSGANVRITLERPLHSTPPGLENPPPNAPENRAARERVLAANHQRANSFALASAEAETSGTNFVASLHLPSSLRWTQLVVRVSATLSNEAGLGVVQLAVKTGLPPASSQGE